MEIDYSRIAPAIPTKTNEEDWDPPPHKYFGPKNSRGKPIPEPVYVHQEYPRTMYKLENGKIIALLVSSDKQRESLGEGWEKTPAAFGYIGAPSREEHLAMLVDAEAAKSGNAPAPAAAAKETLGLPKKAVAA